MRFWLRSTVYKENNDTIVAVTSPDMDHTLKHISVKYNCFRQNVGKESVIRKTKSENQKADIFTKGLQGGLFLSVIKLICGCQDFIWESVYQEMVY